MTRGRLDIANHDCEEARILQGDGTAERVTELIGDLNGVFGHRVGSLAEPRLPQYASPRAARTDARIVGSIHRPMVFVPVEIIESQTVLDGVKRHGDLAA